MLPVLQSQLLSTLQTRPVPGLPGLLLLELLQLYQCCRRPASSRYTLTGDLLLM
jgi:hypothetical protein